MSRVFHTRFNVADSINKDKVYDRHDNVDRLSYVDSSLLVQRFISEGMNLQQARAKSLMSGAYQFQEVYSEGVDSELAMPVYPSDPVIVHSVVEETKRRKKERLRSEKSTAISDINQAVDVSKSVAPDDSSQKVSVDPTDNK